MNWSDISNVYAEVFPKKTDVPRVVETITGVKEVEQTEVIDEPNARKPQQVETVVEIEEQEQTIVVEEQEQTDNGN